MFIRRFFVIGNFILRVHIFRTLIKKDFLVLVINWNLRLIAGLIGVYRLIHICFFTVVSVGQRTLLRMA